MREPMEVVEASGAEHVEHHNVVVADAASIMPVAKSPLVSAGGEDADRTFDYGRELAPTNKISYKEDSKEAFVSNKLILLIDERCNELHCLIKRCVCTCVSEGEKKMSVELNYSDL